MRYTVMRMGLGNGFCLNEVYLRIRTKRSIKV